MKLAWATDIHLNFLTRDAVIAWCDDVLAAGDPDAIVLTGDLAEGHDLEDWLHLLEERLGRPIYFVLGNHDYYRDSIEAVRDRMRRLTDRSRHLTWLGATDVVSLTPTTALVGHDGWGDARLGNHERSSLRMTDFRLIAELAGLDKPELGARLRALGDESAEHLEGALARALSDHREVLCLTHVPPVREAVVWKGRTANDEWAPYFTCKAVGDVLLEGMRGREDRRLTVLAGHTHSPMCAEPLPNTRVLVGGAEYRAPEVQDPLIEIE